MDEAIENWRRLRSNGGRRVTIIDLYRLVAEPRGLLPHELPRSERLALARAAMPYVWAGFEVTAGTERDDPITVVEYDSAWPARFNAWRGRIAGTLGKVALRIDHVGSTAVLGLAAKPIVDIQVSVAALEAEAAYTPPLESLGLRLRSRDALHRYFRPDASLPRDVH